MKRTDISFSADGAILRGWWFAPQQTGKKHAVIVISHGYAAHKEMYLDRYASRFAAAGYAVLAYDHRGFGDSDGEPRQEINPWQQIEDTRHAITFASTRSDTDENQIGVWGTSYSGGHAIVLGATDRRVKCVVAQVPTVNGTEGAKRRIDGEALQQLLAAFALDRKQRAKGGPTAHIAVIPDTEGAPAAFRYPDALHWYSQAYKLAPLARNEITLRSVEFARGYNPGQYISLISPTPLLMIVADSDQITPADLALQAYNSALEPKSLVLLSQAGNFDAYEKCFEQSVQAAVDWFLKHLIA